MFSSVRSRSLPQGQKYFCLPQLMFSDVPKNMFFNMYHYLRRELPVPLEELLKVIIHDRAQTSTLLAVVLIDCHHICFYVSLNYYDFLHPKQEDETFVQSNIYWYLLLLWLYQRITDSQNSIMTWVEMDLIDHSVQVQTVFIYRLSKSFL